MGEPATVIITARDADLRAKAEIAIERVLINLLNETALRLSHVEVDTRNFANCNVEIFFEGE